MDYIFKCFIERRYYDFPDSFIDDDLINDSNLDRLVELICDSNIVPMCFRKSTKLFNKFLELKNYELLFKFDLSFFNEDFILSCKYDFYECLSTNYYNLKKLVNESLLNEIISDKKFDLFFQFLSDEKFENYSCVVDLAKKNIDLIVDYILNMDYISSYIGKIDFIFFELEKRNRIDLCLGFDSSLVNEDFIIRNYDKIVEIFKNSKNISYSIKKNKNLFDIFISKKKMDFALQFDSKLIDSDFFEENIGVIIEYLVSNNFVPDSLKKNSFVFENLCKLKKINLLLQFDSKVLSDDFIINNIDEIIDYILLINKVPLSLQENQIVLEKLSELNKIELCLHYFEVSSDFIDSHFDEIIYFLTNGDLLFYKILDNKYLFDCLVSNENFDLAFKFASLIDDEFIKNNLDVVVNYILSCNCVSFKFKKSELVFKKLSELKRIDLCFEFYDKYSTTQKFITNDFIVNNIDDIVSYIENYDYYVKGCLKNRFLFEVVVLDKKRVDLAFLFDSKFLTNDFLDENFDDFVLGFKKNFSANVEIKDKRIFDCFVRHNRMDLALLVSNFVSKSFCEENFDKICELIENGFFSEQKYKISHSLVEVIFEKNRMDLLLKCKFDIPKDIISDNLELFANFIRSNPNYYVYSVFSNFDLFLYFLNNKEYEIASVFNINSNLNEDFLNNYFDDILLNNDGKIFDNFNRRIVLLWVLKNKRYDLLEQFDSYLFEYEDILSFNIYDIIKNNFSEKVPLNLLTCDGILRQVLNNHDYELALLFYNQGEFLNDENLRLNYSKALGISLEDFNKKIDYLFSKNDEVLSTLNLQLLGGKFNKIGIKNVEFFAPYVDIQSKILELDSRHLDLIIKMINYLDSSSYDICPIISNILNNYFVYSDLFDSIDINRLSENEFHNLLILLQNSDNYLNINSVDQLNDISFNVLRRNYFIGIEDRISNNDIGLDELKKNVFLKRFGLNMSQVEFIINRYCKDIELINNSNLPKSDIKILNIINHIYKCSDIEELKFYFIGGMVQEDFYSAVCLESRIRKNFAKLYSDSLYKLNDKDKVDSSLFVAALGAPEFYVLKDDFNMQIHVLGAYSKYVTPENFKDDWNMPKIQSHGVCTSYIGSNQIANARDSKGHPVYGFSSYEDSALLLLGNEDLVSRNANLSFSTSYSKTSRDAVFFPPNSLIDYTRHTHNEVVIERKNLSGDNSSYKRMPDYVVYFVDDINNKSNFDSDNSYFKEIYQAAVDHNIPIVIVDRLYYAKRENYKCNKIFDDVCNGNYSLISDLIVSYMNNMVGCRKYEGQNDAEYHNYFTVDGFNDLYDKLLYQFGSFDVEKRKLCILNLYKAISNEYSKVSSNGMIKDSFYNSLKFPEKLMNLKVLSDELNLCVSNNFDYKVDNDMGSIISNFYYSSNDEIKKLIYDDLSSGLSEQEVVDKIANGFYDGKERNK